MRYMISPHPKSLSLRERELKAVCPPFALREKGPGVEGLKRWLPGLPAFAPLRYAVVLLLFLTFALPASAQRVSDDDVNDVAEKLYCPVCENIPLDDCPTAACVQWREEIRTQLAAGATPQQVIDDFVRRFGERVVGTPQDPFLRALSLVTPWLIGIGVVVVAFMTFARWHSNQRRHAAAGGASLAPLPSDTAYRTQIERDLQARR